MVKYQTRSPFIIYTHQEYFANLQDAEQFAKPKTEEAINSQQQLQPPTIQQIAIIIIDGEPYSLGTPIKLNGIFP